MKPTFLSTFSGAGGLDLGLEAAGFSCVGTVEKDKCARETLLKNRPEWHSFHADDICEIATSITLSDLGLSDETGIDLLAGAPPCQPFSNAAQWAKNGRKGLNDPRAETLTAFLEIAERLKPKVLLLENVPGFGTAGGEDSVRDFFESLSKRSELRYTVTSKVIDCAQYGVPQRRKRLIIIASRVGSFDWDLGRKISRTTWDALWDIAPPCTPQAMGKWADLLPSIPEGYNYLWHSSAERGKEIFGNRTRFWNFLLKLAKDRPAWTLAAQPGPGTGPFHWDNRPLASEEAQRLQTFPKSWKFSGSHRERIHLIGNATPPLIAERLGRAILSHIGRDVPTGSYRLGIPKAKVSAPEPVVESVPEKYLQMSGAKAAHPGTGLGPSPRTRLALNL